jgi:hypothetical protein
MYQYIEALILNLREITRIIYDSPLITPLKFIYFYFYLV